MRLAETIHDFGRARPDASPNLNEIATPHISSELERDEKGNIADSDPFTSGTLDYTFNWDNKLSKVEWAGGDSLEIKYDPDGNRIWRKSTASSQSTERKYIVDVVGDLPVILMEIDPADASIVKSYIHANGQILAQRDGGHTAARYFYLHDRLGSVRQIINSSGVVVKYCTFEPFGRTIESGGTFDDPFAFTGQYFDAKIGEYYLRARQYNPTIARFTARDAVLGKLGQPLTLHKYLYCANDPINYTDPEGEFAMSRGVGISAGISVYLPGVKASLADISIVRGHLFGISDDFEFFYTEFVRLKISVGPKFSREPENDTNACFGAFGAVGFHHGMHRNINSVEEFLSYDRGTVPGRGAFGTYRGVKSSVPRFWDRWSFGGPFRTGFDPRSLDPSHKALKNFLKLGAAGNTAESTLLQRWLGLAIRFKMYDLSVTWAWNTMTIGPLSSDRPVMPY